MHYLIHQARYIAGHVVFLRFADGTSGEVDLAGELDGPVFQPLRDPAYFKRFTIHPDFRTLVWPNGADFAPESLYRAARVTA